MRAFFVPQYLTSELIPPFKGHAERHGSLRDYDYSPVLPGFELFQTGLDFDPAEEAFARRNRRRKKKKGRGL